jgi:hypothetical protein
MGLFGKKTGPGIIRIEFCGYVNNKGDIQLHRALKPLQETANNDDEARIKLTRLLIREGSIKDGDNENVGFKTKYKISNYTKGVYTDGYAYIQDKKNPTIFYHDFILDNSEKDNHCDNDQDGGRKRRTRKTRSKRNKKSRKTRRNRK